MPSEDVTRNQDEKVLRYTKYYINAPFQAYATNIVGGQTNILNMTAGHYYLVEMDNGYKKISTSYDGSNPLWVSPSEIDSKARTAYEYYNIACPMNAFTSLAAAGRNNASESKKLGAGSYYLVETKGDYAKISSNPNGSDAYWIKIDDNTAKNATRRDQNVEPSNTNTVSGYKDAEGNPISRPNTKILSYDPNHFNSYIKNLLTGSLIEFELPKGMSDNVSAEFENTPIRGRSMPFHGYSSTSDRTISISLPMHADLCKEEFDVTIDKLRALCYPGYTAEVQHPLCYVRLGDVVHDTFIVNNVGISYADDGPFRQNKYTYAEVSLELVWTPSSVPSVTDIEAGKGR